MAASMLSRARLILRGPAASSVAPMRARGYSERQKDAPHREQDRQTQERPADSVATHRYSKYFHQQHSPRTEKMPLDQEWSSVYPTAAPFKPSAVPLPVRMGFPTKRAPAADKIGNLELVKVPNFLHLTPLAIKKHCAVLKEFCTLWPAALASEDCCSRHFPIQLQAVDYVSAGLSLRNPKARAVTLQVKLSSLNLNDHATKKLKKLVGSRYNAEDDVLTIRTNRCPVRKQNWDYALYLLTVLYHESWKTEAWESEREESDMDEYVWEGSASQRSVLSTLSRSLGDSASSEQILQLPNMQEYRLAMLNLRNQGESEESVSRYKESVKNLLGVA